MPLYPRLAASTERLSLTSHGNIHDALKAAYRDSTTHVLFAPLDLIARKHAADVGNTASERHVAMSRLHMRFVTVKTVEQQDIQDTHRIREELNVRRTAKANQIRGSVAEYGLVAPKRLSSLRAAIPCWLEDAENGLTHYFRSLLQGLVGRSAYPG